MSVTGLPPRPRVTMTPSPSPRKSPAEATFSPAVPPISVQRFKSPTESEDIQPFKILKQSPQKLVIEISNDGSNNQNIAGLLSQHFSNQSGLQRVGSDDRTPKEHSSSDRTLASCTGRTMGGMASEDAGNEFDLHSNASNTPQDKRAKVLSLLKARKQGGGPYLTMSCRESASYGSNEGSAPISTGGIKRQGSAKGSDVDPVPDSVSSSFLEEYFCEQIERGLIGSGDSNLARSGSSNLSPFNSIDSEVPSCSAQTCQLVRINSRKLGRDLESFSSSISRWSAIDEDSSEIIEGELSIENTDATAQPTADKEKVREEKLKRLMNPEIKPAPQMKSVSAFASISHQAPPPPKFKKMTTSAQTEVILLQVNEFSKLGV